MSSKSARNRSRAYNAKKKKHLWHDQIIDEWFERAGFTQPEAVAKAENIMMLTGKYYKVYKCPDCHQHHIKRKRKNAPD